jgi:hypothetical protein
VKRPHPPTPPATRAKRRRAAAAGPSAACPAAAARTPDARTLYLAASEALRVTSTGEALVVSRPRDPCAPVQRIPIARVLRVVCNDSAEWSGAALALCLQRGISIAWLGSDGAALGHAWPQQPRRIALADALEALCVDHLDWPERYESWVRHQRMSVLRRWARERQHAGQPVRETEWQQAKKSWVYQGQTPQHLPLLLQGMASALVAKQLADCGLRPHYWCSTAHPIALAADLLELVWAEMNLCAGALADAVDQPKEAAALFERWSGRCSGALHEHLGRLSAQALSEVAQ